MVRVSLLVVPRRISMLCLAVLVSMLGLQGGRAQGAEWRFELTDHTGRGFAPDLVHYALGDSVATGKSLSLQDDTGAAIPMQIDVDATTGTRTLSFVAGLEQGATRRFTLSDAAGPEAATDLQVSLADPQTMRLSNAALWVTVPQAARSQTFDPPVPANTLPAPLLSFGQPSTSAKGAGRILSTRLVQALRVETVAVGPAAVRVRYELRFAAGGYYRAEVELAQGLPLLKVREDFDLPTTADGASEKGWAADAAAANAEPRFWELNLADGWEPNMASTSRTFGNGGLAGSRQQPLAQLAEQPLYYLVPDSAWGAPLSTIAVYKSDNPKPQPSAATPMIGWIPLNKGDWRRTNALEATVTPAGVTLGLSVGVWPASWQREVTSATSPFSMQEQDPTLPLTYGRRVWGLVFAPPARTVQAEGKDVDLFYQCRLFYGVVGLDAYKDFDLDWPGLSGNAGDGPSYPRVFSTALRVPMKRTLLASSTLTPRAREWLAANTWTFGTKPPTDKQVASVLKDLRGTVMKQVSSPTIGHHHIAANYAIAAAADDLLGWPDLPAETSLEMRRLIALIVYLYESPDVISYGNGSHPGNPNMGTARIASANVFAALVPDHPMAAAWQRHLSAYTTYKTQTQIAPGGGYFEYGAAYHMHGGARVTASLPGLAAYEAPALPQLYDSWSQDWRYYMNLLTPYDRRWRSRMIPGMANSPPGNTENFLDAAGALLPHDPTLAAELLWAWRENGANDRANLLGAPIGLTPQEPALTSAVYPGVGMVFRAHQGPDETYMLLRSGFNWSHWYVDQGHFLLHSRGVALAPSQPYQYWNPKRPDFDLYNTIRFGHPENSFPHAWPDSNLLDYALGATVDYAWSSTGYPAWYISPGAVEAFRPKGDAPIPEAGNRKLKDGIEQTPGAFDWDRQVMFLKAATGDTPSYFVFRDSTSGPGSLARWLYLNVLGDRSHVTVSGPHIAVKSDDDMRLDYVFLNRDTLDIDFHEENQPVALYNTNYRARVPKDDPEVPSAWVDQDGNPLQAQPKSDVNGAWEQHTFIRVAGKPGQDYFYLAYPRRNDAPPPAIERLGDAAAKITTPEGTDYIFMSPTPIVLSGDEVEFQGRAGAIRIHGDSVTLALTSGRGRIGWKGHVLVGTAPFERTFKLADLTPGETLISAPPSAVVWQPPKTPAGHQGPLVVRENDGDTASFRFASDTPILFQRDGIDLEAAHATVQIGPDTVRIVVPDAAYARILATSPGTGQVGVRGLGPFDLTFKRDRITGRVDGRLRSLCVTWPQGIHRPAYTQDGVPWLAGWADDHSYGKTFEGAAQFGIAFGVHEGPHEIAIQEWQWPALPTTPARQRLK